MLQVAKPRILLVHGSKPIKHLSRLLGSPIVKGRFTPASYRGSSFEVFAANRHFAYVSREYVSSIAALIKQRVHLPKT
jgi:hypothetical protein